MACVLNTRTVPLRSLPQEGFKKAMQMVGEEFLDRLDFYRSSWLPARVIVEEAVGTRHQVLDQFFDFRFGIATCVCQGTQVAVTKKTSHPIFILSCWAFYFSMGVPNETLRVLLFCSKN